MELLKNNSLAVQQAKDVLFRYSMFDECLMLYYHKQKYSEILHFTKAEFIRLKEES